MLSHAEFVSRTVGTLPEGAEVVTIGKYQGQVAAFNSMTFSGNQGLAAQDAALFRRILALLEVDAGCPVGEVADRLRVDRRSVQR